MRAIISELPFVDNTLKVYAKKTQRRLQNLETITKLFQMVRHLKVMCLLNTAEVSGLQLKHFLHGRNNQSEAPYLHSFRP